MTIEPTDTPLLKAPQPGAFSVGTQLVAFFAGIAGGLAFVQLYGGGFIGVLLAYISPIPLFLVGLTCGRAAAVTATLFALLTVLLRSTPDTALFFAIIFAIPAMVLTRVALIKQDNGEFIPFSAVLLTALTLGTILMAATAALLELHGPGIAASVQIALDNYKTMLVESNPQNVTPEQIDESLAFVKPALPALFLMSWFMIVTITGVFSQWFASEIKQNLRPTPTIKSIELPSWMVGIFALCLFGSFFVSPDTQMVLSALATLYAIGFIFAGIGCMHRWIDAKTATANWSDGKRLLIYVLAYAAIFIAQVPVFFLLLWGLIAPFTSSQYFQRTVTPDKN